MNRHHQVASERGSIYVLTLLSVAAVGSMILIGVSLRNSRNSQSMIVEQIHSNSTGVLDAAELAIARIAVDENWNSNAQKGMVFADLTLGDRSFTSDVFDAETLGSVTDSTSKYRVNISSEVGVAKEKYRFDVLLNDSDYAGYLSGLGAVHYWPLSETKNPTSVVDHIGAYKGVYQDPSIAGMASNDEGGKVPLFQSSNDHVSIDWGSDFMTTGGTVSVWVKLEGESKVVMYGVLGLLYQNRSDKAPTLSLNLIDNRIVTYVMEGGNFALDAYIYTSSGVVKNDQWHNIVMRWGKGGVQVYVDGVRVGSNKSNEKGTDSDSASNGGEQPLRVGGGYYVGLSTLSEVGFVGSVAHVAWFQKRLSEADIDELSSMKPDLSSFSYVQDSWSPIYE